MPLCKLSARGILLLLAAALSLSLPLAATTAEFPYTPAGKVLAGYLEALDSGNKNKLEAPTKTNFSSESQWPMETVKANLVIRPNRIGDRSQTGAVAE